MKLIFILILNFLDPDNFKVTVIGRNDTEDEVIYTNVNESLLLNCESSPSNPPVFSKIYEIYSENKLIEKKVVNSVGITFYKSKHFCLFFFLI